MSPCFWGHDWGKWETRDYTINSSRFDKPFIATKQVRVCKRCNKLELQGLG